MSVLAFDLATVTGWAYSGPSGEASGVLRLGSDPLRRLYRAEEEFAKKLRVIAHGKGDLVYERPIALRFRAPIRIAFHLEAALLLAAREWRIPEERIFEVPPATIKKFVTGKGNAKKPEVIKAVRDRWGLDPEDDNEADAFALLRYHLSQR